MQGAPSTVVERLRAAGCVAAEEEAEELADAAPDAATLEAWIGRREQGEPLAWVTGRIEFCDRTVLVDRGVYVPRRQSEELARRAARVLPEGGRAVDFCTGTGAVAVHLRSAVPSALVVGIDVDRRAVGCARRNGVLAVAGDLDRPLRRDRFDLVTAVAPYVPTDELRLLPPDVVRFEPRPALDGGPDGLDVVRRVVAAAARVLVPGGWLFLELGGEQDVRLAPALTAAGFEPGPAWYDEDGDLRGTAARATRAS